jgi:hypothetical protein
MGAKEWQQQHHSDDVSLLQNIMTTCSYFSPSACHHVVAQCIPTYAMISLKFA